MPVTSSPWLIQLGMACLGGGIAIIVVYLACRLLPRLSPSVRCWLWWLACLKLLVGLIPLPAIALPILSTPSPPLPTIHALMPAATPVPAIYLSATPQTTPPTAPTAEAPTDTPTASPKAGIPAILLGIWLVGIGVGVGIQAMSFLQLRRLAAAATVEGCPTLARAARKMGLTRTPMLRLSPSPIEPVTVATPGRPLILMSYADRDRLTPDELLSLFAHECAHIRRGDLSLSLIPWLAQTLFWFFPLIHPALREFELAREAACDQETVAALTVAPRAYGELLVKLSTPATPLTTPASVMALSAGFRQLKRRIEMLEMQTTCGSMAGHFLAVALAAAAILVPLRLSPSAAAGLSPTEHGERATTQELLPNLDFSQGLAHWRKTAMGSDTEAHPFYDLGVDTRIAPGGKVSGFVQQKVNSSNDPVGDGGVLRYDIADENTIARYRGKRLRWSADILGENLTKQGFLFVATQESTALNFSKSSYATPASPRGWQHVECVFDVPATAKYLSLGLRLEGGGKVYGNDFRLDIVAPSVALSPVEVIADDSGASDNVSPPHNLDFTHGLADWWNDNPDHTAAADYAFNLAGRGPVGGPAVLLQSIVPTPHSYGTFAQNAVPGAYIGKRIRFSAYLKTEDAARSELWMVVHNSKPNNTNAWNANTTGKSISGTHAWTKIEYTIDVPKTTTMLSFGVALNGKGKLWVSDLKMEVVGPSQDKSPERQ